MSFTSNLTGFPIKICGNDGGGVPNVGTYTRTFCLRCDGYICITIICISKRK